jgi:type VI protein secretion system component Hcp
MPSKQKTKNKGTKVRDLKTKRSPKGGAVSIQDIPITKPIDKSTPKL